MITSMRGCVAHNDLWPWPISSRSFGLDLENRVRSLAFTVLDGFFFYLAQMITIIRGCVTFYVFFRIWKFEFLANFLNFSALTLKKNLQFSMDSFHLWYKWSLVWESVLHLMTFDLDLYLQGHLSAKGKDHHGVSSGWSSVWHRSNTGLSSTQYEQIPIILGIWPFWLTPFFFRSITFWRAYD